MSSQFPVSSSRSNPRMNFEQLVCWAMSAACAGGGIYGYMQKASRASLIAGLGFGALYGVSARLIQTGRVLDGVDLSILASTLVLVAMGPRAYTAGGNVPTALSAVSGIILARMGYVSYGLRHGKGV